MKKLLTYVVVLTTVAWSIGLFAMPLSVAAASTGDLIKLQCAAGATASDPCKAVYYLGTDSKRYVFPNEKTYKTWYADFSGVKIVSATELASYMIGGNVTYRPGVKLVKITTSPKVYAVAANGTLREIGSEAVAKALYGDSWATMVQDIPDSFWVNYTVGAAISAAGDYDTAAATSAATSISVDKNLGNTTTPVVPTGTSLRVEKAVDTPAAGIAVGGARIAFTKINLTASADGDVIITDWKVARTGLGVNDAFSSIDILDASTMTPINSVGKTLSSINEANFTEDMTIPAGTTKTIILAGNMASSLASYAGQVPTLSLKSLTLMGSTAIVGTLPIEGNYQQLNGTLTIGTATVAAGAYAPSAGQTIEVGKTAFTFQSFKITAGSAEDMQVSAVKIYQNGSASWSDLANIKLYRDGTELATGVTSGSYATFTFSTITIPKGQSYQFQVKADVAGGSGRTVDLAVYSERDIVVKGTTYGYEVPATIAGAATPELSGVSVSIAAGTLKVTKSNTVSAGNITVGSEQVLGAFDIEAKGEAFDVSALSLDFATSTSAATCRLADALTAVKIVDKNGNTVAGPNDISDTTKRIAYSGSFTVPVGVNTYKVIGTVALSCGWTTNDTVRVDVYLPSTTITARGQVSSQTASSITPATDVEMNLQTVKAANLAVTRSSQMVSSNYIVNQKGILLGKWTLDASNSGEDIRVTALSIRSSSTGKVGNLVLKSGSVTLDPSVNTVTAGASATATFALSTPLVITKGQSVSVELYGDDDGTSAAGEVQAFGITSSVGITATGATTGNSATVTVTANDGALMTVRASGTLTITQKSTPPVRRVYGGSTGVLASDMLFQATNEDIEVTQFTIHTEGAGVGATTGTGGTYGANYNGGSENFGKVFVKKGTTIIGNQSGYDATTNGTLVNLQTGELVVPQGDTGVQVTLVATINPVETTYTSSNAKSNSAVKVGLWGGDSITAKGVQSQASTISSPVTTGTPVIVNKAYPIVTVDSTAPTGSLARVRVTATGGDIGLYRLTFSVNTTAGLTLTQAYLNLSECSNSGCNMSNGQISAKADPAHYTTSERLMTKTITDGTYNYLKINSGATAVIDLKITGQNAASVTNTKANTSLLGDTATSTTAGVRGQAAAAYNALEQGNFVWSDLVSNTSASTGETTDQWYNGYGVRTGNNDADVLQATSTAVQVTF